MKAPLLICCTLVLTLLSACVSQDITQLRVGMTKEEVIKIMGKPDKTTVKEKRETLYFRVARETVHSSRAAENAMLRSTPDAAKPLKMTAGPSGSIPKADYGSSYSAPIILVPYWVVLEEGKTITFGKPNEVARALELPSAGITSQDISKLRAGMTKEQVIKIMGQPERTNIQNTQEWMYYKVLYNTESPSRSPYPQGKILVSYVIVLENGMLSAAARPEEINDILKQPIRKAPSE